MFLNSMAAVLLCDVRHAYQPTLFKACALAVVTELHHLSAEEHSPCHAGTICAQASPIVRMACLTWRLAWFLNLPRPPPGWNRAGNGCMWYTLCSKMRVHTCTLVGLHPASMHTDSSCCCRTSASVRAGMPPTNRMRLGAAAVGSTDFATGAAPAAGLSSLVEFFDLKFGTRHR